MRGFFRVIKYSFLALLVVSTIGAVINWRYIKMFATYNPIFFSPNYDDPANETEARLQDLDYIRKLMDLDRSFSPEARVEFERQIAAAEISAGDMSEAEFYMALSRAVALGDNGHTNISTSPLYREFPGIPVKFHWFDDGLFAVRAASEFSDLVGSRLVAVDGRAIDDIVVTLAPYRGGPPQWRKNPTPLMIESPAILHAVGLADGPERATYTFEAPGGARQDLDIEARPIVDGDDWPRRWEYTALLPALYTDEDETWARTLTTPEDAPFFLQETTAPVFQTLPNDGHYIRTLSGVSGDGWKVRDFYAEALDGVADASLDYLVLDFRLNGGGDYTRSIPFAKLAPEKVKSGGRLYLVTNANTFSAAIVTTAMLKYYGGDKSIIIGEPAGDREQFWAERGMFLQLPNTEYYINYATGYHDWANGCKGEPYCFTLNEIHEVPAGSLTPSVTLAPTYADYAAGRDVVMDWIAAEEG